MLPLVTCLLFDGPTYPNRSGLEVAVELEVSFLENLASCMAYRQTRPLTRARAPMKTGTLRLPKDSRPRSRERS